MIHRSPDADKINEILHYTHAIPSFVEEFSVLAERRREWEPFCNKPKVVDPYMYLASAEIFNLLHWMRKYTILVRFLDMRRYYVDKLADVVQRLHSPNEVYSIVEFERLFEEFLDHVKFLDNELKQKTKRLSCAECIRLDEALVCYENYAFHASVIMAVSAVEARITASIRKANLRLYNSQFSKFTLGRLISIFDSDKFKDTKYVRIKKLMPDRHRPLVTLLNQYRVFSAHPKEEQITAQIADSMLHLSFAFMLDKATCPYKEKELIHH
jgi:hypothetical protein